MIVRIWISSLIAVVLMFCGSFAFAQGAAAEEALNEHGSVSQDLALTAAQKSAIYNAIRHQRVRPAASLLQPAVGASVPPTEALSELPDAAIDAPWGEYLKYAMVADDVVVVDPVRMRVVDVIHGSVMP